MSRKYLKKGETLEEERINLVNKNKYGSLMKVIEYNNATDILVQFAKGKPIRTSWRSFINGSLISPYDKTVYNVGYIGEGGYRVSNNKKHTLQYNTWNTMLQRCYDSKRKEKTPTYKDCTVAEEWLCFNTFASWFDQNFYVIDGERIVLDKDILYKGNKIYSPDTCIFVPERVNILFTKSNSTRGNLPIGVHYHKKHKKFMAHCSNGNKTVYLGSYNSQEEAFYSYKIYKEKIIKQTAEEYRGRTPKKLYQALIKYEVEITD